jgi:3-hydroxybutyryl-CoA dehydrogenase
MEIKTIAIIGAGAMGLGVAQVSAAAGYDVVLNDISDNALERAINAIKKSLNKIVSSRKKRPTLSGRWN